MTCKHFTILYKHVTYYATNNVNPSHYSPFVETGQVSETMNSCSEVTGLLLRGYGQERIEAFALWQEIGGRGGGLPVTLLP
jgi:hypothetical protein